MSDDITDRPGPQKRSPGSYSDRPSEPTPPLGPREDEDGDKLGSLSQAVRSKKLNEIRNTLLAIGILTILVNGVFFVINREVIQKAPPTTQLVVFLLYGVGIGLGILFVAFGLIVKRFPVPVTIISLALYVGAMLGFGAIEPSTLGQGIVFRLFVIFFLAKGIMTALAYEKERGRETRLANED